VTAGDGIPGSLSVRAYVENIWITRHHPSPRVTTCLGMRPSVVTVAENPVGAPRWHILELKRRHALEIYGTLFETYGGLDVNFLDLR
jgi:CTP synthase (UTP-ammonia lyase)